MDSLIQISKINDFLFCPHSIYLHTVFDNFSKNTYQETPQIVGSIVHETLDTGKYSTRKNIIQGQSIYSTEYGICGKIDLYDKKENTLIERKRKINRIHSGYIMQMYAQYFCLRESGILVKNMFIHSLVDNKMYKINLPTHKEETAFVELITHIKKYSGWELQSGGSAKKCSACIYSSLCILKN